jgi:photosystem II stability/assembly factor-like uncharacterized protein
MIKSMLHGLLMAALILTGHSDAQENTWITNGPYNCSVMEIAIHPVDNLHIYLGTVGSGIFETFDGGQHWQHIDSDILPATLRVIAFHPWGPDTMYAATTQGLYKSTDAGQSWNLIIFPCGWQFEVSSFIIHPTQPNIMFVTGPVFSLINYRSTDGGQTWQELSERSLIYKFYVDPVDDGIIYFITHSSTQRMLIYRSDDFGDSWLNLHNNLDTAMAAYDLAIDYLDNRTLYIGGHGYGDLGRCLFKSTDAGESWFNITPDSLLAAHLFSIFISPHDRHTIFITTHANGVMKSTDGGQSWQEINNGLVTRSMKIVRCNPDANIFYLGTYYHGIYRSTDNGDTWGKISYNIASTSCLDYAINPQDPTEQFVCAVRALYKTSDYGQHWDYVDVLQPDYNRTPCGVIYDRHNPDNIFVSIPQSYISAPVVLRSTDSGANWEALNNGLADFGSCHEMRIGYYGTDTRIFVLAGYGLYYSDDYGDNWHLCEDLPSYPYYALEMSPADNQYLYVSVQEPDRMYRSADAGLSWSRLNIPGDGIQVNEIYCHPLDASIVLICKFNGGLFKSTDAGDSWENITDGIPYDINFIWLSGIAINPLNSNNWFINSHHFGVFQSPDAGESWESLNDGLNTYYNNAHLRIDPLDTCSLYLATLSQSVWRIVRTPTGIYDEDTGILPNNISLFQNYPNPFNASTIITYTLPQPALISLDIYDLLGRKVQSVFDGIQPSGEHSLIWKAEGLSSGIYFYKLTAGDFSETRKMILVR